MTLEQRIGTWATSWIDRIRLSSTLYPTLQSAGKELAAAVREEALVEVEAKLNEIGPAHTYASENATLYRGFDNGVAHCLKLVAALKERKI